MNLYLNTEMYEAINKIDNTKSLFSKLKKNAVKSKKNKK